MTGVAWSSAGTPDGSRQLTPLAYERHVGSVTNAIEGWVPTDDGASGTAAAPPDRRVPAGDPRPVRRGVRLRDQPDVPDRGRNRGRRLRSLVAAAGASAA